MSSKVSHLLSCVFFLLVLLLPQAESKSPAIFEFFRHLQGCRKGDNVKGLNQLKKYLKRFGYINDPLNINSEDEGDDGFDDFLESAIKAYQANHRLDPTGVLDAATVSLMATPRCGVADIVNGQNLMQRRRRLGSFHAVSRYAFFDFEPKWPDEMSHLTYGFAPGTPAQFIGAVEMAFAEWAAKSHFSFSETDYESANLQIALFVGEHGDGYPFDGPGGVLAHAVAPTGGSFHIDADENWSTDPLPDAMDIQSVALHEIGHLLGLAHSDVPESIMWPSINSGAKNRVLHADDVQGIRALYSQVAEAPETF